MPNIPPISATPFSRVLYHDLDDTEIANLRSADGFRDTATAWQIVNASILPSGPKGQHQATYDSFPDTSVVEGLWVQDMHCREGGHDTFLPQETTSRALVSFGTVRGREDCVEADANRTVTLFYRNERCRAGRKIYEEGTPHIPSAFEPKCMVVLLATESLAALRDEFVSVNRILSYPLKVNVSYVAATSADPDLDATSTSCALGALLRDAHRRDRVGQDKRDELNAAQAALTRKRGQLQTYQRIYEGLPIYLPPAPSPPPPPTTGPAPPTVPTLAQRLDELRSEVTSAETRVHEANAAIGVCSNSRASPCGRASILAPDPWMGIDPNDPDGEAEPCFGAATRETLEGAYCGYWGSDVNVNAADATEASQLLAPDGAPFCFTCGADDAECENGASPRVLRCPETASRTNRAGVYELTVCESCIGYSTPCTPIHSFAHIII